ncbi:hypothetical protein L218DRAFT_334140 [Marasmius fiardii PR-910]|nr:hypothetical protein L218DRAFT_334140 [Marasmius fiardii PR-910]
MQTPVTDGIAFKSLPRDRSLMIQKMFRRTISPSERNLVSHFLDDAEKELEEFQTEINKLNGVILSLENKRDGLRNRMKSYRSLLSPIHRLPPEILANVFAYSSRPMEILQFGVIPDVVLLSMVCVRWREVVLSTPSLWSNIQMDFGAWVDGTLDAYTVSYIQLPLAVNMVEMFLERSRPAPLTLKFGFPSTVVCPRVGVLLEVLCRVSERWRSLDITLGSDLLDHRKLGSIPNLPSLEHLDLRLFEVDHIDRITNFFAHCPSLTSLSLSPMALEYFPLIHLPWQQIKKLQLYSTDDFESVIEACSALEWLELREVRGFRDTEIISSSIKTLLVQGNDTLDLLSSLRNVSFPTLSTLDLSGATMWKPKDFADFLDRSSCNITRLKIRPPYGTSDADLIPFLRLLPSLQTLHIVDDAERALHAGEFASETIVVTRNLFKEFSAHQNHFHRPPFLPRLTDLTLTVCRDRLDKEAFVDAVRSRWLPDKAYAFESGVDCLQSVSVFFEEEDAPIDVLDSLNHLRDAGLEIRISRGKAPFAWGRD